jgi:MATE family multidrug resistance protein
MNVFIVAVMPMTGMSIAVSVLVGQRLGASNPDDAERVTLSALHLAVVFFAVAGLIAVIWPSWFISPFSKGMDPTMYREVIPLVQKLMKLVAVFCMFKSISLMIAGALKGAGDTHFVAWTEISSMWLLLVLPTVLLVYFVGGDLLWSWGFFVLSGITICLIHWLRFRTAKWKLIRMCKE